jgi:hypothetical protein
VFDRQVERREALVKNDLQKVRDWAAARIKAGNVPDWSWHRHVKLIEAVDAVLHDISVASASSSPRRHTGRALRLIEREDRTSVPSESSTKRKSGALH